MPISPAGSINLAALTVPNVYVQIQPPNPLLQAVPTNKILAVGIGSWGAVNSPTVVGTIQQQSLLFGPPLPQKYDLGTVVYVAGLQGAANFTCVRVTDGTDIASSGALMDNTAPLAQAGAFLTAKYTGELGNTINAVISQGSSYTTGVPTYRLTVYINNGIPEVFDNIGGAGNVFWQNLVSAVNEGQSIARGPSQIVIATLGNGVNGQTIVSGGTGYAAEDVLTLVGGTHTATAQFKVTTVSSGVITDVDIISAGNYSVLPTNPASVTGGAGTGATFDVTGGATGAPVLVKTTLAGGTNGNTGVTSASLVGLDTGSRTGMYALRGLAASSVVILADADDPTQWSAQSAFSLSESCYVIGTIAAGYQDNISGAVNLLRTSAINNYDFSLMHGDWCQIYDPFNSVTRFISPQSFKAGILATILPSDSALNKQIVGIIATQKTAENRVYSDADLSQLRTGRIDVITNPIPAGNLFGCRFGINTSSNPLTQTDNYPRLINFIAVTIAYGMGQFVGLPQTTTVRVQAKNAVQSLMGILFNNGLIGDVNYPNDPSHAYFVQLDADNNPNEQVQQGFMQCNVQFVEYAIIQYLIVNLGASGALQIQALPPQPNLGGGI